MQRILLFSNNKLSKELEIKVEQLSQLNQELKNEKEKLKEKLKQSEENLNHQIKVAKNLELVLERLQNGFYKCLNLKKNLKMFKNILLKIKKKTVSTS